MTQQNIDFESITYFKLMNPDLERIELKRVWAIVLAFLLVVGVLVSAKVLASILAAIFGGEVTVGAGDGSDSLWLYVTRTTGEYQNGIQSEQDLILTLHIECLSHFRLM